MANCSNDRCWSNIAGVAWDNYDVNTETLDGKDTLHATVGICYQPVSEQSADELESTAIVGRRRRKFEGKMNDIEPFRQSLKTAKFTFPPSQLHYEIVGQEELDMAWLLSAIFKDNIPLHTGFYSRFTHDSLPRTTIAYMDPIPDPPTRNDVVHETMVRTMKVAHECKQEYAVVTYDLAVAMKAFAIQALRAPAFDSLIILLGNFHVELAFFGALGTFIAESGAEYLLIESGVLTEGSMNGFVKGKFYNRCSRVHQLLAATMEKHLFEMFLGNETDDWTAVIEELLLSGPEKSVPEYKSAVLQVEFKALMQRYESFLKKVMSRNYGDTAAFWAIYIYLVNRVHRQLQRSIRTNDVDAYLQVLPSLIDVFFALHRPNYARWASLFLQKMLAIDSKAKSILDAGVFSIRRTEKHYARSAIDLTLEQTVNRDAASPLKGITAFRNSTDAFRRWSITLTQRGMALSELKELVGMTTGEEPMNQLRPSRIKRDNADQDAIQDIIQRTCNPFSDESPSSLVNIASGKAANKETSEYLLSSLERGREQQVNFAEECSDSSRFYKPIKRTKVINFASENAKKGKTKNFGIKVAESISDVFGRILNVASSNSMVDLQHLLSFSVTNVPLSLAHPDGTPLKTEKATLTKALEAKQTTTVTSTNLPFIEVSIVDGGLLLHETILQESKSTYGQMARRLLEKVCGYLGSNIHVTFDRYTSPSIKDAERQLRGATDQSFSITGPDQSQRRPGNELLKVGNFKEQFTSFVMDEWQKQCYANVLREKVVYVSHGGNCIMLQLDESLQMSVSRPSTFQAFHEEADTLIAFHASRLQDHTIMVRSSDTDVLVILLGLIGRLALPSLYMDYGSGNNRRYIDVSDIAIVLEEKQSGLTSALIGLHALTGCDFTSAIFRKGKVRPFAQLENGCEDDVLAMESLSSRTVDYDAVTAFVCSALYNQNVNCINTARHNLFLKITKPSCSTKPMFNLKRINYASLPPCNKVFKQHVARAGYVARLWRRADQMIPSNDDPIECGWQVNPEGFYEAVWFEGDCLPLSLTSCATTSSKQKFPEESDDECETDVEWDDSSDSDNDLH